MFVICFDTYHHPTEEIVFKDRTDAMTAFACKLYALLSGNLTGHVRFYGPDGKIIQHYVVCGCRSGSDQLIVKLEN